MWQAVRLHLSVYIINESRFIEAFYLPFPRFTGSYLAYHTLDESGRERIDLALKNAKEIAERFNADGRLNATKEEILKAFNRNWD